MELDLIKSLFTVKLSVIQIYLLWFLLGSFTVATLSDLKNLSAQKEFLQIWIFFTLIMLGLDIYSHYFVLENIPYLVIKWGLIIIVLPLYFHFLRKISWGDVFAKMAACSLFSPILILIFFILVEIIDFFTRFIWKQWGDKKSYPFMPVIFLTTMVLLIVIFII